MDTLEQQVGRARRRLTVNVFLERVALAVLVATGLWAVLLLVERAFVLGIPVGLGVTVAALIAVAIAVGGTMIRGIRPLRAAVVLDEAAALKERISTALTVQRDPDPFARAVVRDAERVAGRVHVPAHLPYRAPALWPWSLAAIVAATLFGLFMPNLNLLAGPSDQLAVQRRAEAEVERQNINQDLTDRLNKIKQMTENNPALQDLAKDLQPLETPDTPTLTPEDIRREAAKKIDRVADRLAEQKEQAGLDALKDTQRMLSRLQPEPGKNPAAELSKSLAAGDFEGAKKALQDLEKQLQEAAAKGDAEAQQRIAQMQDQLKKLADQLAELDDALYLQKELQNKAGLSEEEAKKLAEQLAKMDPKQLAKELQRQLGDKGLSEQQIKELVKKFQQQQKAKKTSENLGQCLAQAAQALQECNRPGSGAGAAQAAAAALSDVAGQLADLEASEQLLGELEAQLSDLRNMRDSVCQGGYCRDRGDRLSDQVGPQGPQYGRGIGSRIGRERTPHAVNPTKAPSKAQGGTIIGQMLVDGPQMRGQATAEEREAVNAAQRDAQDAIDRDRVPRQYHGAVQKYFEQLAGLVRPQPAAPAKPGDESKP